MNERDYPRPEDFETMREMVDTTFIDNSSLQVQDDIENFYEGAGGKDSERVQRTISEASKAYSIATFLRDEAAQALVVSENKGLSEQSFMQEKRARLDRRLDILSQLINPSDSGQSVDELLKIVRTLHRGTKSEVTLDGGKYIEIVQDYEDLEGFLLQFNDSNKIESYRQDNFSYRNWLESGEV
ncbi:MAG: hypothetical protein WCP14_02710 [bacterium]